MQVRRELAQVACFFKDPSLEAARKGRWRSKLGVGGAIGLGIERTQDESPAEGAVAFSTCLWGWIGSMVCPDLFGGFFIPFQQTKAVADNRSDVAGGRPKRYPLSSPCFSIRIRRASRRGRGGVFDLPMGMGRFHAQRLTFLGNFLDIPFQQTKAVAGNCSDVAAFPPLRLCASARVLRIRRPSAVPHQ